MISTLCFLLPKVSFLIVGPKNSLGCMYLSSKKRASFLRIFVAFSSRISNLSTIGFFLVFFGFSANFFSFSLTSGLRLASLESGLDKVSYGLPSPSDVTSLSFTVFSVLFNSSSFLSASSCFSFSASSSPFFSTGSLSFSSSSSVGG